MKWYIEVMKKYAVFSGRARRKEYWMFFLCNMLISIALSAVTITAGYLLGVGEMISDAANGIYFLAVLIPSIAVGVRRMHDIGRSGWWILCPIVNLIFLFINSQPGRNEYGPNPKEA